ncbi:uncharacterized protein LOC125465274 [Stegostoma tigrinum]|uniref:uncharacterized protein LOC125465274 n=1 Tax=Stegostoma tigrinum TaxID=3053191 RepID=UPI00202B1398|nr:uncharacterized protein LOC125465274 [Stegostoma tigrinum]
MEWKLSRNRQLGASIRAIVPLRMESPSRLDEVGLALDNLQEAKSVLQQIENKLHFQEEDPLLESSIQKRSQSKAFGCRVNCAGDITKQGASPQQPSRRPCGTDKHKVLSFEWSSPSSRTNDTRNFNSLVKNCHSSRRMFWDERSSPLYNDIIDQGIPLSALNQTTAASNQDKNDNLSIGVTPTRLHSSDDMDTMENYWFPVSNQETCSGFKPSIQHVLEERALVGNDNKLALDHSIKRRILQEKERSPVPSISAFPPTPPGSPLAQRLEWSHSPVNKLERLKERIRRQRNLEKVEGTLSNRPHAEQPIPAPQTKFGDPFSNGPMKHWVRKVTFAPPAPAYKGKYWEELLNISVSKALMDPQQTVDPPIQRLLFDSFSLSKDFENYFVSKYPLLHCPEKKHNLALVNCTIQLDFQVAKALLVFLDV